MKIDRPYNETVERWTSYWRSRWSSFDYNFGWSDYVFLFDGWVAKCAMAVPAARLKFIYFGLIFLGSANILYRIRRPFVFKIGTNQFEYVENALKHFTVSAYIDIHGLIRHEGHHTLHGKYYDSE